jgi:hypothetical protein
MRSAFVTAPEVSSSQSAMIPGEKCIPWSETKHERQSMFLRRITLTFLVATAAGMAQTTTTTARDTTIGPVGLGSTETVQVNIANLASNSTSGAAASCTGSITFNNTTGNPIGTSTTFTVTAGQIFSAALPFAKISSSTTRTEVIGVIAQTFTSSSPAPCNLHYSLETYDTTTGATHVYLSGAGAGFSVGGPGR